MHLPGLLNRRRPRSRGQSLAEFALILPVFLVILSTAIDLGRMAYARVTIANVAREASFQAAQTPTSYQAGQACNTATNMVICRGLLESKGSVVTVNPADIILTCTPDCSSVMGNTVSVKAVGRFNLLTPVMAAFFGTSTISFSSTSINQINALPAAATSAPTAVPTATLTAAPTAAPTATSSAGASPTPTAAPTISCASVSAGFTYSKSPSSNKSPVTVTVTDTTTYNPLCPTVWSWSWGDGVTTTGQTQPPHVYYNSTSKNKTYILSLTVTSGTFTSTVGGYAILVKP
jgi:Flp pilus assembly protein TadG